MGFKISMAAIKFDDELELKKIKFRDNFDPTIEIPESEWKKKFKGKERR